MAIPIASAVAAYTNAAKSAGAGVASIDGGGGVAGGGFGDMLKQAINSSIGTLKEGESQSMKALSGKSDIGTVVAAVSNAQLTLQTVTAVRDRVISAYQSIMQMAI
jgi:flagellar hook-basal body complex protein FliE